MNSSSRVELSISQEALIIEINAQKHRFPWLKEGKLSPEDFGRFLVLTNFSWEVLERILTADKSTLTMNDGLQDVIQAVPIAVLNSHLIHIKSKGMAEVFNGLLPVIFDHCVKIMSEKGNCMSFPLLSGMGSL